MAEQIQSLWQQYIQERFYDAYEPWIYDRQYAILKSIIKTKPIISGSTVSVSVYIDMNEMNKYHPNSQGEWDGQTVVEMIENVGMTLVNGIRRDPSYAYESVLDWMRNDYEKFLKANLKL